uniref:Uncharacterized protein n=1 Tax=Arundo donax TaxID=35708 RepID=A0A0A9TUZ1_ARUDO
MELRKLFTPDLLFTFICIELYRSKLRVLRTLQFAAMVCLLFSKIQNQANELLLTGLLLFVHMLTRIVPKSRTK